MICSQTGWFISLVSCDTSLQSRYIKVIICMSVIFQRVWHRSLYLTGRKCPTYPLRWPDTFKSSLLLKKLLETAIFLQRGEELLLSTAALHFYLQHRTGAPLLRYCHCITEFLLHRVKRYRKKTWIICFHIAYDMLSGKFTQKCYRFYYFIIYMKIKLNII